MTQQAATPQTKLGFLPFSEWNEEDGYIETPPKFIQYTIEWKVTVNNIAASRDAEFDVVLTP
ncbi:hypothetical protein LTR28_001547, partial [Elasticomyces elasticus]